MLCTVIICSHNPRYKALQRVLEALKNQTLDLKNWELLLIDNASKKSLSEQYDLSWHPHACHLQEPKLGKLNAWFLGLKESRSDLIVCVDDDTVLNEDYLEKALLISSEWPFVGAWGGKVVPEFEVPLPDWIGSEVWRLTVIDVQEDIWSNLKDDFQTVPVGAGMCVRRLVAKEYLNRCMKTGALSLDRSGTGLSGYGDIDLALCAVDVGLGTGKSTKLSLTHLIPAARLTIDYFARHAEGDAASLLLFRAMRGLPLHYDGPPSCLDKLRIQWHYIRKKVPLQRRRIHQAHITGLEIGFKKAHEYLKRIHQ